MTRLVALLALTLLLPACSTERALRKVQPPKVVTKVVEVYKPLPDWAVKPLPNVPPKDSTVESLVKANNARAETLDLANCERRLLAKIDKGEPVNPKDCKP